MWSRVSYWWAPTSATEALAAQRRLLDLVGGTLPPLLRACVWSSAHSFPCPLCCAAPVEVRDVEVLDPRGSMETVHTLRVDKDPLGLPARRAPVVMIPGYAGEGWE